MSSLVSRHVSRPAQYTQHFVLFCHFPLLLLLSPAQAQGWSRPEYTVQIHETLGVTVLRIQNLAHSGRVFSIRCSESSSSSSGRVLLCFNGQKVRRSPSRSVPACLRTGVRVLTFFSPRVFVSVIPPTVTLLELLSVVGHFGVVGSMRYDVDGRDVRVRLLPGTTLCAVRTLNMRWVFPVAVGQIIVVLVSSSRASGSPARGYFLWRSGLSRLCTCTQPLSTVHIQEQGNPGCASPKSVNSFLCLRANSSYGDATASCSALGLDDVRCGTPVFYGTVRRSLRACVRSTRQFCVSEQAWVLSAKADTWIAPLG